MKVPPWLGWKKKMTTANEIDLNTGAPKNGKPPGGMAPAGTPHLDGIPDKEYLYGRYQKQEDRMFKEAVEEHKLAMKVAHKSLDIPQEGDPLNIDARHSTRKTGFGPLAVAAIAGITGLPAIALALLPLLKGLTTPELPPGLNPPVVSVPGKHTKEKVKVDYDAEVIPPK